MSWCRLVQILIVVAHQVEIKWQHEVFIKAFPSSRGNDYPMLSRLYVSLIFNHSELNMSLCLLICSNERELRLQLHLGENSLNGIYF